MLVDAFTRMKSLSGRDMIIYGSPGLTKSLTQLDLIDEYHLMVNPIILGNGRPLFGQLGHVSRLQLVSNTTLEGSLLLN